jgi:hypothetical protein
MLAVSEALAALASGHGPQLDDLLPPAREAPEGPVLSLLPLQMAAAQGATYTALAVAADTLVAGTSLGQVCALCRGRWPARRLIPRCVQVTRWRISTSKSEGEEGASGTRARRPAPTRRRPRRTRHATRMRARPQGVRRSAGSEWRRESGTPVCARTNQRRVQVITFWWR